MALGFAEWTAGGGLAFKPFLMLADPRVGPAGFGALAAHAILCPSDRRKRIVLRIGVVLEIVRFIALAARGSPIDVLAFSVGYGFFAAALTDFVAHREWRSSALTALVPIGMASAPLGLAGIVRRLTPLTYDGALYALDATFGVPFSRATGEFVDAFPALRAMTLISYAALPGAIAAGLAYEEYNYRRGVQRGVGVNLLFAYTVSGTIAAILYVICPGTGPYHAFPSAFPGHLPDPHSVALGASAFAPLAPRNAMPSLHFAWAVLLWRSVWGSRLTLRLFVAAFMLFTTIATIGSGEHYVVDLIAAVPFLVALEAATAHRSTEPRRRIATIIVGSVLYAAWILIVRSGPISIPFLFTYPAGTWALATASIFFSVLLGMRSESVAPGPLMKRDRGLTNDNHYPTAAESSKNPGTKR